MIEWNAVGATDVGRARRRNEDAYHVDVEGGVFVVADGMGGHAAGQEASRIATREVSRGLGTAALRDGDLAALLTDAYRDAREAIVQCIDAHPRKTGMGTTLVSAVLRPTGEAVIANLGDSRAYLWRGGELERITHDHSWVQREVDAGRLAPQAAEMHPMAHVLTRVLSAESTPDPDLTKLTLEPGDRLLLASDGLTRMVPEEEIAGVVAEGNDPAQPAAQLIDRANQHGGDDNITVVLVAISGR